MTKTRQVCIATYLDDLLAEVARSQLEARGIPAFVARDDCGHMLPNMANLGGFRLTVDSTHAAEAGELLQQAFPETEPADAGDASGFEYLGTFSTHDARLLLDEFMKQDIPFYLAEDASGIRRLDPVTAANGGTFGTGSGVAVFTKPADGPRIAAVYKKVLKIEI